MAGNVEMVENVGMVGNLGMGGTLFVTLQSQIELCTDEETPTVCVRTTAWPLLARAYLVVDVKHVVVIVVINWLSDQNM